MADENTVPAAASTCEKVPEAESQGADTSVRRGLRVKTDVRAGNDLINGSSYP